MPIDQQATEQTAIRTKIEALYKQQEQLRANLAALNPAAQEATFRKRILK